MSQLYKPSYYTREVPHGDWTLLFNGVSSGLLRLPKAVSELLAPFLGPRRSNKAGVGLADWRPRAFAVEELPPSLQGAFPDMLRARFFVPAEEDEIAHLRKRTQFFKQHGPFLVTITTTMDCNFDCYYCYEDKSPTYLSNQTCDRILEWIRGEVEAKGHETLYVDWYGGEPMLNQEAIEYFTQRALSYCDEVGIRYKASMVTNGSCWPEAAREFVERNKLWHIQISIDGPPRHHDVRRAFKPGHEQDRTSFEAVAATIDKILGAARIYLRINVDLGIGRSALEMVELFRERGWLRPEAHVYPYLASIGPMTDHCGFLGENKKVRDFQVEFDQIKQEFQRQVAMLIEPKKIEHLQYYPNTRGINCAAVAPNSVMFGPDAKMYRCSLDVGFPERSHGTLGERPVEPAAGVPLKVLHDGARAEPTAHPYDDYDPYSHPRCSQCQYLPICMGGCPKTHFENNEFYIQRQSQHWENNFEAMIRSYADASRVVGEGGQDQPDRAEEAPSADGHSAP